MHLSDLSDQSRPRVVLDTNVVLDWLVFRNPAVATLAAAIEKRDLIWLACPAMRQELAHMLGHASLARWVCDSKQQALALKSYDACATMLADPKPSSVAGLRCSDPDDQIFIDLALACHAQWLLSHDRALLKLARRARLLGVDVLRPQDWAGPSRADD